MNFSEIRETVIKEEMEFPKLFAPYEERDYGILFYNTENKESGDSNHAVLCPENIQDLRHVLRDIAGFYKSKDIRPHSYLYHPFVKDYFIRNANTLKKCGFQFTICPDIRVMLLTEGNNIHIPKRLGIRHIKTWDEAIERDVSLVIDGEQYLLHVIKNSMKENNYLFIGYLGDEAVSLLSFHVSDYGCTRFDEMHTAKKHRSNGYAREMTGFAVDFHRAHRLPVAYQWPAHRSSQRITTEAGFQVAFSLPAGFAALDEIQVACGERV